jgi:hypothetical protein
MPTKKKRLPELIVRVRCTMLKEIVVSGCTPEEAAKDPWLYATNEDEGWLADWTVLGVRENS